jgi:hypothetical protein
MSLHEARTWGLGVLRLARSAPSCAFVLDLLFAGRAWPKSTQTCAERRWWSPCMAAFKFTQVDQEEFSEIRLYISLPTLGLRACVVLFHSLCSRARVVTRSGTVCGRWYRRDHLLTPRTAAAEISVDMPW